MIGANPLTKGNPVPNRWPPSAGLAGGTSGMPPDAADTASSMTSSETALKTAKISGATVLTNAVGVTLCWFAPTPRPSRAATVRAPGPGPS
jgi:hypothetical protein